MTTRDLTNRFAGEPYLRNNGFGKYSVVRDVNGRREYASVTPELEERILTHIRGVIAGGRFGSDDSGEWYPMGRQFVDKLQWPPRETERSR